MGTNRFFWPQELLDQWIVDEKVSLQGEELTILEEKRSYKVSQAVYFNTDVSDGNDPLNLIGRVKEIKTLEEIGAEHYMDSVIVGDSAYEVVMGFTGEPIVLHIESEANLEASDLSGAITAQTGDKDEADDRELLAKFLLENL